MALVRANAALSRPSVGMLTNALAVDFVEPAVLEKEGSVGWGSFGVAIAMEVCEIPSGSLRAPTIEGERGAIDGNRINASGV